MKAATLLLHIIFSLSAAGSTPIELHGIVWNSTNVGLHSQIYIVWKKDQTPEGRLILDRFMWKTTLNNVTGGMASQWFGYGNLQFLNSEQLSLDPADGQIYLGNEAVGDWKGHPSVGRPGDHGFRFYSQLNIDEKANTISVDEVP